MNQSLHGGAIRDLVLCVDEGMQVDRGESMHVIIALSTYGSHYVLTCRFNPV